MTSTQPDMNRPEPDSPEQLLVPSRPRMDSAALAGIAYSLLGGASLLLLRTIPMPSSTGIEWESWITEPANRRMLLLALNLTSIASVMFLWFVAVIRRRVGDREDRFFATVFLGSALVYVCLWLMFASLLAAPAILYSFDDSSPLDWETYRLAEGIAGGLLLVAGPRIEGVFVASTSTVILRTGALPKWVAYLGYAFALGLFVVPVVTTPVGLGLPAYVLITSITILVTRASL